MAVKGRRQHRDRLPSLGEQLHVRSTKLTKKRLNFMADAYGMSAGMVVNILLEHALSPHGQSSVVLAKARDEIEAARRERA